MKKIVSIALALLLALSLASCLKDTETAVPQEPEAPAVEHPAPAVTETPAPKPEPEPAPEENVPATGAELEPLVPITAHEAGDETRVDSEGWTEEVFHVAEVYEYQPITVEHYTKIVTYDDKGVWRNTVVQYPYYTTTDVPEYDESGELIAVRGYFEGTFTDLDEYENGLIRRSVSYASDDSIYSVTEYLYDGAELLSAETTHNVLAMHRLIEYAKGVPVRSETSYYDEDEVVKIEYNARGLTSKLENYFGGALSSYEVFEYDENGFLRHSEAYSADGSQVNSEDIEFSADGYLTLVTITFPEGERIQKCVVEYDHGVRRRETYDISDGSRTVMEYDENGDITTVVYYDKDGNEI